MNTDPSKPIDLRGTDERLRDALHNPVYLDYAFGYQCLQPLTLDQVDPDISQSEQFTDIIDTVAWPDGQPETYVDPPYEYESADYFMMELFESSLEVAELKKEGKYQEADEVEKKALNNFNTFFRVEPATLDENGVRVPHEDDSLMDSVVGSTPALLRAYAVAPDLMQVLHDHISPTRTQHDIENVYLNGGNLDEDSRGVADAAYMAYRIMGRLVRRDDDLLQRKIAGIDDLSSYEVFETAHRALTR